MSKEKQNQRDPSIPGLLIALCGLVFGLVFFLGYTGKAQAGVAFVQVASSTSPTQNYVSVTMGSTVSVNDLLAVAVNVNGALTTVTSSCVTGNLNIFAQATSSALFTGMAYGIVASSGPCTVSADFAASGFGNQIVVHEVSGVNTVTPLDASSTLYNGFTSGLITSGTSTTSVAGDYIFGFAANAGIGTTTPGTGFTQRVNMAGFSTEGEILPASGTISATFNSTTSAQWIAGMGAFKPLVNPLVNSFSASPIIVVPGGTSTLSWNVENASSVLISPISVSTTTLISSTTVSPTSTTIYTLSASNSNGTSTATTSVAVDTSPPTVPQNLTVTTSTIDTISLSWSSSTDAGGAGLTGYDIARCLGVCTPTSTIASTTKTTYTDSGLIPSSTYTYAVAAYDSLNVTSNFSSSTVANTIFAPWSGIIDPSRAIDWRGAGIPGGIPTRTAVCALVSLTAGTSSASSNSTAITNALNGCNNSGQVVMLPVGTYYVAGIDFNKNNNVTLRGAGPDKTILLFTAVIPCFEKADVCILGSNGWAGNYPTAASWAGGYAQGATTITVGTTTGNALSVGQIIVLDQRDDAIGIATSSGATESGTTTTVITSIPHNLSIGQSVAVGGPQGSIAPGYQGVFTVTSVPSSTSFTYTNQMTYAVTGASWQGGVATVNIGTGGIFVLASDTVTVSGMNPGGYDGTFTVTSVTTSQFGSSFTYALGSNPGNYVSGGSMADPHAGLSPSGGGEVAIDTGGAYISCVGGPTCSNESGSGKPDVGRACPDANIGNGGATECQPGEISYREQVEFKQITAINGNQMTISPALENTNWRSSRSPGIYALGNYITGDGVENVTLDFTNDGADPSVTGGIFFGNAYESWVKNARTINGNRAHVWINQSARIDVVDSYFFGTKNGHSQSYGVQPFSGNSDNLIQNNICQHIVSCVLPGGDSGSVYAYNYMVDSGNITTDFLSGMQNENHDFTTYDLFEGNDTDKGVPDDIHGDSTAVTNFRNRLRGQDTPAKTSNMTAGGADAFNRFANFVGNVLGTPSVETQYQATGFFPSRYVWEVGGESDNGGTPNDATTTNSLLRWGNYDTANSSVQWNSSEIPTSSFAFINGNAVPATHTLPNSFYLSAQPSFWATSFGTPPYPAIGPDVSGGTASDTVGGYSYAIPGQMCYQSTAIDPSYQQTFTVTGASYATSTQTVVLTIGSNTLVPANTITVAGVTPSGYNGAYAVTATSTNAISYVLATSTNPGVYASGGTVAWPNILNFNAQNCYPQADPPTNSPTISSFSSSPAIVATAGTSTLSWNVTNASSVLISPTSVSTTTLISSTTVNPTTTTLYTLSASNANGTSTASTTVTVDSAPPTVPTSLTASATSSSEIDLSWASSTDDTIVVGYIVYQGQSTSTLTQIATTTSLSYANTGLSASTLYYYAVAAYDAINNISARSTSTSATTKAASSGGGVSLTSNGGGGGGTGYYVPPVTRVATSTPATGSSSLASLEAELASLEQTFQSLLAGSSPFTKNLGLWDEGPEVRSLQQFLNREGLLIASKGNGSPGHETTTFGLLTYRALVRFQGAHHLPPTGFFGPLTRHILRGLE